jgi:hypothetical protein
MLTALPSRFYFEAIGLAGFRVPQKSRPVQAPIHSILLGSIIASCRAPSYAMPLNDFLPPNEKRIYRAWPQLLFPILVVKTFGNGRAEKGVPLVDFPNGGANTASGGLFDQVAHCAGFDRLDDIRLITMRRQHENLGGGADLENLTGGLQPIEQRHGHVHQNQRWTKFFDHDNRLMSVFCFADHFEIVFQFQNFSEFSAHDPIVIRQQDFDSFHGFCYGTNIVADLLLTCC